MTSLIKSHLQPPDYLERVGCTRPITSVYINPEREKQYGFVELGDVGLTLAVSTIDDIQIDGGKEIGGGTLRIRRPNDYDEHRAKR